MASDFVSDMDEALSALDEVGVAARTKRYVQGAEQWESHPLGDITAYLDWKARRDVGARFRGITIVDV